MMVVAELKKPYSDKERADFIVENNHQKGYQIKETKTNIQALDYDDSEKFENAKNNKLSELTTLCHNFDDKLVNNDMFVISSLGFKINADLRSQNNIKGLIAVNDEVVNFVDYDNEIHKLTPSDLNVLLVECSKNGENLYMQKWAYAEKIKACETIAELEKISFDFKMLDFSKVVDEVPA